VGANIAAHVPARDFAPEDRVQHSTQLAAALVVDEVFERAEPPAQLIQSAEPKHRETPTEE
jgi:hypothetical protein